MTVPLKLYPAIHKVNDGWMLTNRLFATKAEVDAYFKDLNVQAVWPAKPFLDGSYWVWDQGE